jgi:DNA end-binding protein Ku
MARALWKGAIAFGLVHIPVSLYPAVREHSIDFDWLDRRTMEPVGYKRVNKATGKEVAKDDIVRGIQVEEGRYVVLSDEEIQAAHAAVTQAVEIQAFVEAGRISPLLFDRPYLLAPDKDSDKVYVLLRGALKNTRRVAIAQVVIQTRQHLAALMPMGDALMLLTLRWADELRPLEGIDLPGSGGKAAKDAVSSARELQMAQQLIEDMTAEWQPERYEDHFKDEIMALVHRKLEHGDTEQVESPAAEERSAEVIDLASLLKRSLDGKHKAAANHKRGSDKAPQRSTPRRKRA